MPVKTAERISYVELAKRVLGKAGEPLTVAEIWQAAKQSRLVSLLQSTGKTPEASLSARLYTDVQRPTSEFVKVGAFPSKFHLKTLASPALVPPPTALAASVAVHLRSYNERELHPLLAWFVDGHFRAHCRTIYHEKSIKRGEKQNQWIHPDVVGFSLTTKDWTPEVVHLIQSSGASIARLYSFEVKIALDFPTLREYFFQAVSNSSWAHEGYLAAVAIDEDPDFRAELTRLSQSFGIGVIHLNVSDPEETTILLPAREKPEVDWKTVERIAALNPDFREFVGAVAKSIKINQVTDGGFDKLLTDVELDAHFKKLQH